MDLLALSAFQQIADHGGIGRANRATGQPKTTLSRRLRQLEEELGVRLVERGPRVFRLTEEGAALHVRTRDLLAEIEDAGQALAGGLSRPRGRLRVSVPGLFADMHMGRIAADFVARFPEIELEVLSDDRMIDPRMDGVDVVVRVRPHPEDDLIGRLLYREKTLLVAPPHLSRSAPGDGSRGALPLPVILLPAQPAIPSWLVEDERKQQTFLTKPVLRVSSLLMARQAVRNGAGAALLPSTLVESDLRSGTLITLGEVPGREIELWVLHTSRRLRSPKVSAFVEFLCAIFSKNKIASD